jgi:hypothetical protein
VLKILTLFTALTIFHGCYHGNNEELIHRVRAVLKENHPGLYDKLNPNFAKNEDICFVNAKNDPYKYVKCFDDGHLFLRKKCDTCNLKQKKDIISQFNSKIEKTIVYLKIPTFIASKDTLIEIEKIVNTINTSSNKDIIIDIRDNTGGTNNYYQKILRAIFGEDLYAKKMKKYYTDSYIDFRSTTSNIEHLESRFGYNKNGFYGKILDECLQKRQDMCSIKLGYDIKISKNPIKNKFNKSIYILINNRNASAALNFLDEIIILYKDKITLIGEETGRDTLYMNLRTEEINDVVLGFPMQVMRNRLRGQGGYVPNIKKQGSKIDSCLKNISSFDKCIKLAI